MEFVDKEAVIYFVECLSKVKNYNDFTFNTLWAGTESIDLSLPV